MLLWGKTRRAGAEELVQAALWTRAMKKRLDTALNWIWRPIGSRKKSGLFSGESVEVYVSESVKSSVAWTNGTWARLAGAPHGSSLSVDAWGAVVKLVLNNERYFNHPLQVALTFDEFGSPCLVLPDKLDVRPVYRHTGIATRVFATSATEASALGFRAIEVQALYTAESETSVAHAGAYAAARLGFSARLSDDIIEMLPPDLETCRHLHDLMQSESGATFWMKHQQSGRLTFDLNRDSISWRQLTAYLKKKRIQNG